MSRTRPSRRSRKSPEHEALMRLANSLAQSSSRIEDAFWEKQLAACVDEVIANGGDDTLNGALDKLNETNQRACDALADMIEFRCECDTDVAHDALLFAAPVLAWSRYTIPSGAIPAETFANLRVQLAAHVFAADVRLALVDIFFSPDQLPPSYSETARLTEKLTKAASQGRDVHLDPKQLSETMSFLSDTRYVIGIAVAPKGAPLFRWQEADGEQDIALTRWQTQGGEALRPLLPACASELLLPLAFHSACREAERQSRPYSIRASVAFLDTAANIAANRLTAVIALFKEERTEEFRIGFVDNESRAVVHGVVWPLLDMEESNDTPAQIETVLRECGIEDVRVIEHSFPLEYCDDCGVPLYPDTEDEAVHAELPGEDGAQTPQHLH